MDMLHSSPYTSVVVFDQVDDTDSGDYQCNITVLPADSNTMILSAISSATSYLNITGEVYTGNYILVHFYRWPQFLAAVPVVMVTNFGAARAGQDFSLFCI